MKPDLETWKSQNKFVEYQIAFYDNSNFKHIGPHRVCTEQDYAEIEDFKNTFWALEGVLPSETFELQEVVSGPFDYCETVYRIITKSMSTASLIRPDHRTEYAIERLSV